MKKLISILLCLILCLSLAVTAGASSVYVVDGADLLSAQEEAELAAAAESVRDLYAMDVVILTLDSLNGKDSQAAADDYYDENGYSPDGVIFLLAMQERQWYISTAGNAIYALTDYGLYEIEDLVLPYLQNGDYYGAFDSFIRALPDYFDAYEAGDSVDGYVPEEDRYTNHTDVVYAEDDPVIDFIASLIMGLGTGLIIATIVIIIMRLCMNSKKPKYSAADYLKSGSYNLHTHRDVFLYSSVTKTARPQDNNSGGGSGVHTSSSGRSHGGRGGGF